MPSSPISSSPSYSEAAQSNTISPPTLLEILSLTRQLLSHQGPSDSIWECGRAALDLLAKKPDVALHFAYQKLHDVPYREVRSCWRRLYVDAALGIVVCRVERVVEEEHGIGQGQSRMEEGNSEGKEKDWLGEVVRTLDMALILSGAPEREEVVELWFSTLGAVLADRKPLSTDRSTTDGSTKSDVAERPKKRRRLSSTLQESQRPPSSPPNSIPFKFAAALPTQAPRLKFPIPRIQAPSLSSFQKKLSDPTSHNPLVLTGAIDHWPALCDPDRAWNDAQYLLGQTLGGRRLVPVEIGRSYTDEGWGQKILSFGEFVQEYMLEDDDGNEVATKERGEEEHQKEKKQTAYLAQHDLFTQLPTLRSDISVPDYCYLSPAPSSNPHLTPKSTSKLEDPLLNAWFGPKGTVSPLHTDPYHNILAQVVGWKYVRLYPPEETGRMYPRGREGGVDMGNTSAVDLDEAMSIYPGISCWMDKREDGDVVDEELEERRADFGERFPTFKDARYVEAILEPGDCLYLPVGWWHYVRSLSASFSVSFWWD